MVVQAVVLVTWWLWQARGGDLRATLTLFSSFNVGTVLIQWGVVLALLLGLNRRIVARLGSVTVRAGELSSDRP